MTEQTAKPKGWFKRALEKYDNFIKEWGLDQPNCSCVPMSATEDEKWQFEERRIFFKEININWFFKQ
ncbi:Uncharacterised protein [Haemophilus influenzae]|uniref:Uncharacterized protein n=1 Tax=Haemophilus influenzae TaxID=727 RepID=A0A2X1PZL9_HAEIF|nr:Uncharacterised protein [Haemophilus influenzae]